VLDELGPALGKEPVWAVPIVCTVNASGPATHATAPAARAVSAAPRFQAPLRRPIDATTRPTTASAPVATTRGRNHGSQAGVRSSRTIAHAAVMAMMAPAAQRAQIALRSFQRWAPPIPARAAIGGARATVY
jgi:hypothetical protein